MTCVCLAPIHTRVEGGKFDDANGCACLAWTKDHDSFNAGDAQQILPPVPADGYSVRSALVFLRCQDAARALRNGWDPNWREWRLGSSNTTRSQSDWYPSYAYPGNPSPQKHMHVMSFPAPVLKLITMALLCRFTTRDSFISQPDDFSCYAALSCTHEQLLPTQ